MTATFPGILRGPLLFWLCSHDQIFVLIASKRSPVSHRLVNRFKFERCVSLSFPFCLHRCDLLLVCVFSKHAADNAVALPHDGKRTKHGVSMTYGKPSAAFLRDLLEFVKTS